MSVCKAVPFCDLMIKLPPSPCDFRFLVHEELSDGHGTAMIAVPSAVEPYFIERGTPQIVATPYKGPSNYNNIWFLSQEKFSQDGGEPFFETKIKFCKGPFTIFSTISTILRIWGPEWAPRGWRPKRDLLTMTHC